MPTQDEIATEKERLYESSSLRDDLQDEEATQLLQWGEKQIERVAESFPAEFEQKCRFLRQLLKGINRFVGQREFNDFQGQQKYLSKVTMYLEALGYEAISEQDFLNRLPEDPKDMSGTLSAILNRLAPPQNTITESRETKYPNQETEILPRIDELPDSNYPDDE